MEKVVQQEVPAVSNATCLGELLEHLGALRRVHACNGCVHNREEMSVEGWPEVLCAADAEKPGGRPVFVSAPISCEDRKQKY